MSLQMTLLEENPILQMDARASNSGTFAGNMVLPIHRWFRYSAGFSAQWVHEVLAGWNIQSSHLVLDPFAGSGTVSVACDSIGIPSIGVEAHPVVSRICKAKLLWATPVERFSSFASAVIEGMRGRRANLSKYPEIIHRSFDVETLTILDKLKLSWTEIRNSSAESELVWMALTAILRSTSRAGTAQWQYILPNKTKKRVLQPLQAFLQQVEIMKSDMRKMQEQAKKSHAHIFSGDSRKLSSFAPATIDAVITSPPYANNYDYADALRFEMTFWGDIEGWADIHDAVRQYLMVSSSQHSSRDRLKMDDILALEALRPIRQQLSAVMNELSIVREHHGGKKHYHTMVGAYCRDIALVLQELRLVSRSGVKMCWVIGDSAPYGVYCPIDKWISELAIAAGFKQHRFEKLRDRNIKWKNRKHRVPLKEGLLWIDG